MRRTKSEGDCDLTDPGPLTQSRGLAALGLRLAGETAMIDAVVGTEDAAHGNHAGGSLGILGFAR
jgi:hypothetical protein